MNFEDQLSTNFKVQDLTQTEHSLSTPNIPTDGTYQQNLTYLADSLELLLTFMDFEILSGFRTKELQQALTAEGEPTSAGLSFHEVGRAVDIYPHGIDLSTAFGLILGNPSLRERFAEIAFKPSQNALHLAINVPGDTRTPKVLGLDSAGTYKALSRDDQQTYLDEYADYVANPPIPAPAKIGIGVAAVAVIATAVYLLH